MEEQIKREAAAAVQELIDTAHLKSGQILVVGCSSSEIVGERIGSHSSVDAAGAVVSAILPILKEHGIYLAAQCCEHLNRALIVEQACADAYHLESNWKAAMYGHEKSRLARTKRLCLCYFDFI